MNSSQTLYQICPSCGRRAKEQPYGVFWKCDPVDGAGPCITDRRPLPFCTKRTHGERLKSEGYTPTAQDVEGAGKLKHAFKLLTEHYVSRYLMSVTYGRSNGIDKAEYHRGLCECFLAIMLGTERHFVARTPEYRRVHEHTQLLTGYLDKEIGFPVDDPRPDYESLEPLFFNRFYELATEALKEK